MLADKYLLTAKKHIKAKEYTKAVVSFEKIFGLGMSVPNDIYYFYAKSLKNSGKLEKANKNFNLYIEKTGRSSQHYQEALEHIIDLENTIEVEKEKKYYDKYIIEHNGLLYQSFKTRKNENRAMKWNEAIMYCKNLDLNGKDWRLPTVKEVLSMSNVKAFDSGKDYKYRFTHNGGKYANQGARWSSKNYYKRVRHPTKEPNKNIENDDYFNRYYIYIKDKFIKNLKEEDSNFYQLNTIPTSEISYSESSKKKRYFEFSFSKGRLQHGHMNNTRFITCVKNK
jgi:hypothetical protein